jgi:hypothetical protein
MIDLMAGRATLAILTAMSLTACAAVGSMPVNQEVSLRATEGGERVEAACEVSNDKATWTVVAPAVFSVTRSEKPLTVECRTPAGGKGYQVFEAARESELPGGGNAGHGYPRILELVLGRKAGSRCRSVAPPPRSTISTCCPRSETKAEGLSPLPGG